jgi:uncharacterized protein (DUF952 family)/8-oxo-dGTP pyrophosphatase MutT (NUDIX family)
MTEHESCDSVTIGSGELEHRPPGPGPEMIYKLCSTSDWAACEREGRLPWSEADRRDGFVHLSTAHQLSGTAQRHFRGREHLVVLEVDPERLPAGALRWEISRGGDRFPHLYAELPRRAIVRALPAPLAEDGAVQLPTLGPIDRPTARVVLLNDRDQVLLLRGDMGVWFMPGGGLEPGETHEQAAARELWEETSLRIETPGPWVWTRRHVWTTPRGIAVRSIERFFLVRTAAFTPRWAREDDPERHGISDVRWWPVPSIAAAAAEVFAPRRLGALLPPLLANDLVDIPIDVDT